MISCAWPTCPRDERASSLIQRPEDRDLDWWCPEHAGDDLVLPALRVGPWGYCAHCGQRTVWWFERTPLHSWCRRRWVMGAVQLKPKGAYERKRRQQCS